MARSLDTAERERTVISAAWRIIVRAGVGALTVRNVAAEAGLAPSSLRYNFPTQAAVKERALRAVSGRIGARVAALPADLHGTARARALLLELLPLDAERRLEMEVLLALGMASLTDSQLGPLWQEAQAEVREVCAEAVTLTVENPTDLQVDHVHALIDGLAFHLLVAADTARARHAQDLIDAYLADPR